MTMVDLRTVLQNKGARVVTTRAEQSALDAVKRMNQERIGALLVVDDDHRPIGMFTERDVLTRLVEKRADPAQVRIEQLMSSPLVTVGPETTAREALAMMHERRCRHLPVMHDGDLLGMVSIGDLTRALLQTLEREVDDLSLYIGGPTAVTARQHR